MNKVLTPDVSQIKLVTVEEAARLFAQSAAETGINHGHGAIVGYCLEKGLV
jgi:hypothetical protein